MEIKVGFEITYAAAQATPMVIMLSIHPSRFSDIVGTETDHRRARTCRSASTATALAMSAAASSRRPAASPSAGRRSCAIPVCPTSVVPTAQQLPIDQLPDELLLYLMPSRYCETDKLTDIAWSLFGNTPPGWARVQAIAASCTTTSPSAISMRTHEVGA